MLSAIRSNLLIRRVTEIYAQSVSMIVMVMVMVKRMLFMVIQKKFKKHW